jgi:twitching motility protein PilT
MPNRTNLDALDANLTLNADKPGADRSLSPQLATWLSTAIDYQANDVLLVAGAPPSVRVDGRFVSLGGGVLDGREIEQVVLPALAPHARRQFNEVGIADGSLRSKEGGRFRVNLHRERGRAAATIRRLPQIVPRLASLGLPQAVEALTHLPRGLVLVGGATGSGKTTTLAALVNEINIRDEKHIVTIEDPIEYEHQHARSLVEQVEIGVDAPDFATALRAALRQAPDVIVVGEMRDADTMRTALAAGETGHLVLSSLHTNDVASTVARVGDSFPPERQNTIRQELAMALAAVMTQSLLPSKSGGRVAVAELLIMSYGARQHVRKNAVQHLHQEIAMTRKNGSFSFEESLAALVRSGAIDKQDALARAHHPDELQLFLGV